VFLISIKGGVGPPIGLRFAQSVSSRFHCTAISNHLQAKRRMYHRRFDLGGRERHMNKKRFTSWLWLPFTRAMSDLPTLESPFG
jgi:hypothetical protein